jgi:ribosomal protein L11 methyltransferase
LIRLAVRCQPEQAELVLAELSALAPNGFEEEHGIGYVEYAIYGSEGELPDLGEIGATTGEGAVEVVTTEVPDDWADRWQDFHQPMLVGGRVWVRPSWSEPRPDGIDVVSTLAAHSEPAPTPRPGCASSCWSSLPTPAPQMGP